MDTEYLIRHKNEYPEELKPWIERFCYLWKLELPSGKEKSDWIDGFRNLRTACGEHGVDLLDLIFDDWNRDRRRTWEKNGSPHWWVTRPNSLVRVARAKAGEMRMDDDDRHRYTKGKYSEFIT